MVQQDATDTSLIDTTLSDATLVSSARGCMLGLMIGDALGAGVEGWPSEDIEKLSHERWGTSLVQDFFSAVHMASYVSAGEPGMYREARPFENSGFVPTGPPSNHAVARQCARHGMFTDDSETSLALASSLVECGGVDAAAIAKGYARAWQSSPWRGYPPTAQAVMRAVIDGASINVTGLPPHFPFDGGSFANGGAMRISPLAIAYRDANPRSLRTAVEAAIRSSHRHPEALDFAVVQAGAVQYALRSSASTFDTGWLLTELAAYCTTAAMRGIIAATAAAVARFVDGGDELGVVADLVGRERRPGSGMGFQIASVHMMPCVLWCVCRHAMDPRRAIQAAIALGGDTDTTASMVGAIVGALHGEGEWCAHWAAQLEDGAHGRGYALDLASKLACLHPPELAAEAGVLGR